MIPSISIYNLTTLATTTIGGANRSNFTNEGNACGSSDSKAQRERFTECSILHSSFTGKERDAETGYGYFGARYIDHELMTMWISVDPMADKYPSVSPYAYCAWNPVRLVDPDGNHIEVVSNNDGTYTVKNGQVNKDQNIYIIDENGKRTGEILGTMLTKYSFFGEDEKVIEGAVIDPSDNSGKDFFKGCSGK